MRKPDQIKQDETDRDWIDGLVRSAQLRDFFGSLIIRFEAGSVKRVVKEENLMPPKPLQGVL